MGLAMFLPILAFHQSINQLSGLTSIYTNARSAYHLQGHLLKAIRVLPHRRTGEFGIMFKDLTCRCACRSIAAHCTFLPPRLWARVLLQSLFVTGCNAHTARSGTWCQMNSDRAFRHAQRRMSGSAKWVFLQFILGSIVCLHAPADGLVNINNMCPISHTV